MSSATPKERVVELLALAVNGATTHEITRITGLHRRRVDVITETMVMKGQAEANMNRIRLTGGADR